MDDLHDAVSAWFLGPKAENFDILKEAFAEALEHQSQARKNVYPNDQTFITESTQSSALFHQNIDSLKKHAGCLSRFLSKHSVPFWHPRYQAHMASESTFPAILGYIIAIMYNPNNVATEASPFTTVLEKIVGDQLSCMLGFYTGNDPTLDKPKAWGHIACDGSVANLESMWAARNLKFYPLSLKRAILEGPDLPFVRDGQPLIITLADGGEKDFLQCSSWDLLNLPPATVLSLPQALYDTYGVSQSFLQNALDQYIIQTTGKEDLEKYSKLETTAVYFVGTTKHYSWPKAAAITGIGKANVLNVGVDNAARMDVKKLQLELGNCLEKQIPVYAVVAIMGSTEQGAVDPLKRVIEIREEFQKKGLSFVVHCDGAWGGYFASMLREPPLSHQESGNEKDFVPSQAISPYTREQIEYYQYADSITIDPHKSGYVPYPAGGLCYRDGRMRYLITWTSPVVWRGGSSDAESMGIYGVEGSKPGAAPTAAYLSHTVIGLHQKGYGALLGEALFTSAMFYANWVTMSQPDDDLVVVPFSMLPSESDDNPDPKKIEEEKQLIRDLIVNKTNEQIVGNPTAWDELQKIGGDTMINAFACNFKLNGKLNEDITEANYLNQRIFQRASISTVQDVVNDRPIILTSTKLAQADYAGCLDNYKRRLGLKGDGDLYILINVTMSPWPTTNDFLQKIVADFKDMALEELQHVKKRDQTFPDLHGFVMQGTDKLHLVHLPMFYMANHRWQVIITGELPEDVTTIYQDARQKNPDNFFILGNTDRHTLMDSIVEGGSFKAEMFMGLPGPDNKPLAGPFELSNIHVIVNESLATSNLGSYPRQMPFYLYGTTVQQHVDHLLLAAPDAQLNSDQVQLKVEPQLEADDLAKGLVALATEVHEAAMQPFETGDSDNVHSQFKKPGLDFSSGQTFLVDVYRNKQDALATTNKIASGSITLGQAVFADNKMINEDPGEANMTQAMGTSHAHGHGRKTAQHDSQRLVDGIPKLSNMTYSLAAPNTFGLSTEYPVYGDHVEAINQRKGLINKGWREAWEVEKGR